MSEQWSLDFLSSVSLDLYFFFNFSRVFHRNPKLGGTRGCFWQIGLCPLHPVTQGLISIISSSLTHPWKDGEEDSPGIRHEGPAQRGAPACGLLPGLSLLICVLRVQQALRSVQGYCGAWVVKHVTLHQHDWQQSARMLESLGFSGLVAQQQRTLPRSATPVDVTPQARPALTAGWWKAGHCR